MKTPTMTPMVQTEAKERTQQVSVNQVPLAGNSMPEPSVKGRVFSTADLWRLRRHSRMQGLVIR